MRLFPSLLIVAALVLSACGGSDEESSAKDTTGTPPPAAAETTDIRDEAMSPAVLKDPRIQTLTETERRILRAYLAGVAQRHAADSMRPRRTAPPESLARWLDTNLTVGQIINLNRGTAPVEPEPPQPLPKNESPPLPDQAQE